VTTRPRSEVPAADEAQEQPVSVRLGQVVPPEDPEDWTRPLTWIAAVGMVAGPLTAAAWFVVGRPTDGGAPLPATWVTAALLVAGAAATGATQQGSARAFAGTLGAGLFAALATVVVGVVAAGERQSGVASPSLAHAFATAAGGLTGAAVAATLAAPLADRASRAVRVLLPAAVGAAVTLVAVPLLFA
jgi:hypothetical protein